VIEQKGEPGSPVRPSQQSWALVGLGGCDREFAGQDATLRGPPAL